MKSRHVFLSVLCAVSAASPCFAQFNTDDINIGPDGITVKSGGQNVRIDGSGVRVNTNAGVNTMVGPGGITTTGPGVNSHIGPGGVTTRNSRVRSHVRANGVTVGAPRPVVGGTALSLAQQITVIETQTAGKTSEGTPLAVRVQNLEKNNLGRVGSGPLAARVQVLIRELGITMPAAVTTTTTTITNPYAGAIVDTPRPQMPMQTQTQTFNSSSSIVSNGGGITINGSSQNSNVEAGGQPVTINSSNSNIRITGGTPALTLRGSDNSVMVDAVDAVTVAGAGNRVIWTRGLHISRPAITDTGAGNAIMQSQ